MRIQLSPTRIIPNVTTVWNVPGPEVDIVMDLKKLTFAEGFCDTIYSFHVLDHYFPEEIPEAVANWYRCLRPGGKLWLKVDDFEILCREFVGGGITIDRLNLEYTRPVYLTRDNLVRYLTGAGFGDGNLVIWFEDVPNEFKKDSYELVLDAKK